MDFGIWNYNPAVFDMTQAYTSPMFAVLSIIPNVIRMDVVLFFKLFAIITLAGFFCWFIGKTRDKGSFIMTLLFLTLPATFVHAFGGLETFFFVALMTALLILLFEERYYASIAASILLFLTRPEAWLLLVLIPPYVLTTRLEDNNGPKIGTGRQLLQLLNFRRFVASLSLLLLPLTIYFIFHKMHFGSLFPNTFYIKSGRSLSIAHLLFFSYCVVPLAVLIPLKKIRLLVLSSLMFGAMALSYASSSLQMNYAGRFAFQIFAPVYLFAVYVSSKQKNIFLTVSRAHGLPEGRPKMSFQVFLTIALVVFSVPFFVKLMNISELLEIANYYPRAMHSHAALGKTLQAISGKYHLKSFSFGDAGMLPYHSKIVSLDTIGLGSSAVAANGVTSGLLDAYNPDLTLFRAGPKGVRADDSGREIIYAWSLARGMKLNCDVYWKSDYVIRIYGKHAYPEIIELCHKSKRHNNHRDRTYFLATAMNPPWSYWKE